MKKLLTLLVFLVAASSAFSQISMQIMLNQDAYLQYEPVYVRVSMRNMSAHALAFGESKGLQGVLSFNIYPGGKNALRIPPKVEGVLPSMTGVILQPGTVREFTFLLSRFYDIRRLGPLSVKAVVTHPQLPSAYESNTVHCNIVTGKRVWGPVTVGVPDTGLLSADSSAASGRIKTRNYTIVSYFTGKVTAYAMVIDDADRVYKVRRVGFDLGAELKPRCEVDFLSRLNIMLAVTNEVFAYYQFNIDGGLERKKIYMKTSTTPTLVHDKETGIVMPAGGREARRDIDYEEIKELPFTEDMFNEKTRDLPSGIDGEGPLLPSVLQNIRTKDRDRDGDREPGDRSRRSR